MSTVYGGGYANPSPTGRADFGWIGDAWTLFTQAAGTWLLAMLLMFLVPLALFVIAGIGMGAFAAITAAQTNGSYNPANPFWVWSALPVAYMGLFVAFSFLYLPFIYGGVFGMAVKQVRGEQISVADVFSGGPVMLRMLGLIAALYIAGLVVYFLWILGMSLIGAGAGTMFLHAGHAAPFAGFGAMGAGAVGMFLLYLVVLLLFYTLILPTFALVADRVGVFEALRLSVSGMSKDLFRGALLLFVFGLMYLLSAVPCLLGLLVTIPMYFLLSALAYRDMIGMPGIAVPAYSYQPQQPGVWPPPPGQSPPAQAPPPQWGSAPTDNPPPPPPSLPPGSA